MNLKYEAQKVVISRKIHVILYNDSKIDYIPQNMKI